MLVLSLRTICHALVHGFDLYITSYQRCKCATLLGAYTHRNAVSVAMRSAYHRGREDPLMNSLQL